MDDFFEWLGSEQGQLSEQAMFAVLESLENCSVEPVDRVIVFNDGQRLSINQTARRIHSQWDLPYSKVETHIVGWLEMHYEPEGLNEQQMDEFECLIDEWIQDHENSKENTPETL